MKTVVIATNNAHKVSEIRSALDFEGWEFKTLAEAGLASDPVEDADSFEGNARIKAMAAREAARAAGLEAAVLADDSGLAVDALDGAPGVYSSRYAGADGDDAANNAKLLAELAAVPDGQRTARFVCTLVFIDEDGVETVARGTIEGAVGHELRGDGGFGYDPLFMPDAYEGSRSLAEVSQAEKNLISHRGNALRQLRDVLAKTAAA
ncbi:RdgB/HAM1 family non-canonical purine NTP pyrophosphatase [Adlercreutzia sp. R7]|uniref:dITP/XTP pyrophosphatase n=1 Tax=Adlercreutzia wanghongyangiae TaxID=3111451 RepID=A0ABU6IJQ7_9ACTN|nr:RdgB/HAM1 family non-canonical purine NTP pyrophosphatase [Adlercreutzia sp. R7]